MKIESVLKIKSPLAHSKRTIVHIMYSGDYVLNKINSTLKPFALARFILLFNNGKNRNGSPPSKNIHSTALIFPASSKTLETWFIVNVPRDLGLQYRKQ